MSFFWQAKLVKRKWDHWNAALWNVALSISI